LDKPSKKMNFTADRIAGFICQPGKLQDFYWDAKTPGLGVRVTAQGIKSFIFETRLNGRTLRITIGSVLTWAIGKAQAEATRFKSMTDQGIDPRQEKKKKISEANAELARAKREEIRIEDAWRVYIEAHNPAAHKRGESKEKHWGESHFNDHLRLTTQGGEKKKIGQGKTSAGPLAPIMKKRLVDLTSEVVLAWLKDESKTRPTSTALAYRLLRAFVNWTHDEKEFKGLIPLDACSARSVRRAIPTSRAKDGDCLQREQFCDWFKAVKTLSPVMSVYLQALLITGARREEMALLRWEDVDFRWRKMVIRDKINDTRAIPLTAYLASILLELKIINDTPPTPRRLKKLGINLADWSPSEWVFASQTAESGHIESPTKAHNEVLKTFGLPPLTLHGLRRSFKTACDWITELPTGVSAQIMGHSPSAIAEKHYTRRPLDMLRMWHELIEKWILKQAGIDFIYPESNLPEAHLRLVSNL
jgi:integrase